MRQLLTTIAVMLAACSELKDSEPEDGGTTTGDMAVTRDTGMPPRDLGSDATAEMDLAMPRDAERDQGTDDADMGSDDEGGPRDAGDAGDASDACVERAWFSDEDGDGHGNPAVTQSSCTQPTGYVANSDDCNDACMACHPDGTEVCGDGLDQDCEGGPDDGCACMPDQMRPCPSGVDTGECLAGSQTCAGDGTWGTCAGAVGPVAETCNGLDDDCNGTSDDGAGTLFYRDSDGDGFGDAAMSMRVCAMPVGYVSSSTDCNDGCMACRPGGTEVCGNGIDEDCEGGPDDGCGCMPGQMRPCPGGVDTGECSAGTQTCAGDGTWGACAGAVGPVPETCNGRDDDCNGTSDDGAGTPFYRDADGDGFGDATMSMRACSTPVGYVSSSTDCNDGCMACRPGGTEVCGNGLDEDCMGGDRTCPPERLFTGGGPGTGSGFYAEGLNAVTRNSLGDIFVAGTYAGAITFAGSSFPAPAQTGLLVARIRSDGSTAWVRQFDGAGRVTPNDIAVDAAGRIFVVGTFGGELVLLRTLDTGPVLSNPFVLALSADGDPLWDQQLAGTGDDRGTGLAVDPGGSGDVIVSGHIANWTYDRCAITVQGGFVMWLNPADGSLTGCVGSGQVEVADVAVDSAGMVYAAGTAYGSVTFGGSISGATSSAPKAFVASFTRAHSDRGVVTSSAGSIYGMSVSTIGGGSCVFTGIYGGSPSLLGALPVASGSYDAFIARVTFPAGTIDWQASTASEGDGEVEVTGSTIVWGGYGAGTIAYRPPTGAPTSILPGHGSAADGFVLQLDTAGAYRAHRRWGGAAGLIVRDVWPVDTEGVLVLGSYSGDVSEWTGEATGTPPEMFLWQLPF